MIDMKNTLATKSIFLLLASSMLLGCSSRTSIRTKQATQILDMIIFEQSKEETFSRGNEISIRHKETIDNDSNTKYLYELSEKNSIVHIIDSEKEQTEAWYYLESGSLYNSIRGTDGQLITVLVTDDPDAAKTSFSTVFSNTKLAALKKISEVDKPSDIKELILSLEDIDEQKLRLKFQTKKDYNLTGEITIYENVSRKNEEKSLKFEFVDSKLTYYKTHESGGPINEYTVNYTDSVTRESIK